MPRIDYGSGVVIDWDEKQWYHIKRARARRQVEHDEKIPESARAVAAKFRYNPGLEEKIENLVTTIVEGGGVC